ncbi:hypothetical protein ACFX14_006736 [Malus domestica]
MELPNACGGSQRLITLAQKLRLYKPPPLPYDDDIEEQRIEETTGKVVSQVGFAESDTPVTRDLEKFRPKRAAILIYFFEEDTDDLHVILVPMTVEGPPDEVSPLLLSPRPSPVFLAQFAKPVDPPQVRFSLRSRAARSELSKHLRQLCRGRHRAYYLQHYVAFAIVNPGPDWNKSP